jgi:hypothetical protein
MALGEGTAATSWGEVALGLFTESDPNLTPEQARNQTVIRNFDPDQVVLRVGIGCSNDPFQFPNGPPSGCDGRGSHDALRIYKNGTLYLKRLNGDTMYDVQKEITTCNMRSLSMQDTVTKLESKLAEAEKMLEKMEQRLQDLEQAVPTIIQPRALFEDSDGGKKTQKKNTLDERDDSGAGDDDLAWNRFSVVGPPADRKAGLVAR